MPDSNPHRHAAFTLPVERFKSLELAGHPWRVYDNANFSVHVGDKCNADCPFCIAHLRYLSDGRAYAKPEISDDQQYFLRLAQAIESVRAVNPSVSITGGEPTIHRRLPRILDILAAAQARKRTLTTNGTGLHWPVAGSSDTVLDLLGRYRLEHLNISRAHYNHEQNNRLMGMSAKLLPAAQLSDSIIEARRLGIRVRLSCVLTQEGVHTVADIERYLEWAESLGVDNVIFRQLMAFDADKALPGRIPIFCRENTVELEQVWRQLDADARFECYHRVRGYYYYVEIRKFRGIDVASERADLRQISPELDQFSAANHALTAFEMVLHPNGNLCAGWNENERVMTEDTL